MMSSMRTCDAPPPAQLPMRPSWCPSPAHPTWLQQGLPTGLMKPTPSHHHLPSSPLSRPSLHDWPACSSYAGHHLVQFRFTPFSSEPELEHQVQFYSTSEPAPGPKVQVQEVQFRFELGLDTKEGNCKKIYSMSVSMST